MYQLIYLENSDSGEPNVKVRNFNKLEAARAAMNTHFEKSDAILHFPDGEVDDDHYTSRTEDGIYVRDGIDTYRWEIEEITPEDGAPELAIKSEARTVRAVFDPEAGYPRMFLEVQTAAGVLRATANTDEDYPEIYLDFADAKHQDEPERQVAVLQFGKAPEETGKGRLLVWGVDADESATETFVVSQN